MALFGPAQDSSSDCSDCVFVGPFGHQASCHDVTFQSARVISHMIFMAHVID